ncbi:Hypothetical protein CINCED_3A017364 [Cinara cedri]|uniref:Uncharacterized protein n=1 Tax=Cinara cedri TaxID=506608 RepID=A0A5E4M607_9HEMI|nr:Hypothetical protein CINCED_3A017364 [Cinara cedri]
MSVSEQNSAGDVREGDVLVVDTEPAVDQLRLWSEIVAAPDALPPLNVNGDDDDVKYSSDFIHLSAGSKDEDYARKEKEVELVADELKGGRQSVSNDIPITVKHSGRTSPTSSITADDFPPAKTLDGDVCDERCSCFIRLGGGSEGGKSDSGSVGNVEAVADNLEEAHRLPDAVDQKTEVTNKDDRRCTCYGDGTDCEEDCDDGPRHRASTSNKYPSITFNSDDGTTVIREGKRRERRRWDRNRRMTRNQSRSSSKSGDRSQSRSRSRTGARNRVGGVTDDDNNDAAAQHHRDRHNRRVRFVSQADTTPNRPRCATYREASPAVDRQRNRRSKK